MIQGLRHKVSATKSTKQQRTEICVFCDLCGQPLLRLCHFASKAETPQPIFFSNLAKFSCPMIVHGWSGPKLAVNISAARRIKGSASVRRLVALSKSN